MKFIDYDNSLTSLSNSILKHFGVSPLHKTLDILDKTLEENNSKNVVVILYDGLGARVIDRMLGKDNFFTHNKLCEIDSVFPPTTAAATTTVMSGLNPNEHGWIGWDVYLDSLDKTITLFLNQEKDTKIPIDGFHAASKFLPYESIKDKIRKAGYEAYYVSPFGDIKYETLEEMNDKIKELCSKDGKKYIYVYNDEPDACLHEFGSKDEKSINFVKQIEESTKKLCSELEDTTIIVIADHGHLDVEPIFIKDYNFVNDSLIRTPSIDARCKTFFVKEDKKEFFKEEFNKRFSDSFILLTKEEVLNNHLFGDGNDNIHFKDAIGDFLAVAKSNKYLHDSGKDFIYKSHHAGSTEDEVKIEVTLVKK